MKLSVAVAAILAVSAFVIMSWSRVDCEVLPAGQHTASPKYWPKFGWHVTNYTPLEFDRRIDSLTPGTDHDLWFSVGASIEHIDAHRQITIIHMPHDEWIVSGIAITDRQIWFSAGQSGKVGIVDADGRVRFIQVVARRDFPDIGDIVVNGAGEMWFLDRGRSSIGYRSPAGWVAEQPFGNGVGVTFLASCMGKLWAATKSEAGLGLAVIDGSLRPRTSVVVVSAKELPANADFSGVVCDASDRLWLVMTDWSGWGIAKQFDAGGHFDSISLPAYTGGGVAADRAGGVWLTDGVNGHGQLMLLHINRHSAVRTYILPTTFVDAPFSIAVDADQRIWLAVNDGGSPIAVTELEP